MTSKDKPPRKGGRDSGRGGNDERKSAPRSAAARPARDASPRKPSAASAARPDASDAAVVAGKPERISKIMARAGVASRRDIERMIMEGRVRLNGQILETPVVNATLADHIEVDGQPIRGIERTRMWLYHKLAGLVTTNSDPEGRPTVFENLPEELPRVLSIGRLDINTEGLLLLTNDGGLSRVLELPSTGWLRRYRVRAHGDVDQAALDKLKDGIAVDGVLYGSIEATLDRVQGRNVWITMGLREGKNREIKNVLGALGLEVNRLIRISYGPFQLGDLPEGQVVEVRGRMLRDQLGPRLIEEAKANFDAPIHDAPAGSDPDADAPRERSAWKSPSDRARGAEDSRGERSSGGPRGDKPRAGKSFGDKPRGGKSFGDSAQGEERPKKRPPMGTSRTANVWMAPGARPERDGKPRVSPRAEAEKLFNKRPDENTRRVVVKRADDDKDWIRADEPPARKEDGEGRSRGGPRGDRPARGGDRPQRGGDRPFGDRPRGDRPARSDGEGFRSERPRGTGRPFGDKPSGDRPRGDRPARSDGEGFRSERPRGAGRPFGDKPSGDRPRGDRPARSDGEGFRSERPRGAGRPFGDKPSGDRPRGDRPARSDGEGFRSEKPAGARPFGGKPGGKPFGGKPSGGSKGPGGKPSGGKPAGGGRGGPRGADRRR